MSEMKPREFWIDSCRADYGNMRATNCLQTHEDTLRGNSIHVIEKSAFDKAISAMNYMRDRWCIKPDCKCMLCETLKELGCDNG